MNFTAFKNTLFASVSALAAFSFGQVAHAASLAPGILSVQSSCSFDAAPQGFYYTITDVTMVDGSQKTIATLGGKTASYYTGSPNPGIGWYSPQLGKGKINIGTQSIGNFGGLGGNNGFLRNNTGAPIDGTVYKVVGYPVGQSFPQGTGTYVRETGISPIKCDDASVSAVMNHFNQNSTQRPPNFPQMPPVSGASKAYNSRGPLVGSVPPPMPEPSGMTHDSVEAFLKDESMNVARTLSLMKGITQNDWGDYIRIEYPVVGSALSDFETAFKTHNQSEFNAAGMRLVELGLEDYIGAVAKYWPGPNQIDYRKLTGTPAQGLTVTTFDDDSELYVPPWDPDENDGFETRAAFVAHLLALPNYPKPTPPMAGGNQTAKTIYPAYLYEAPKSKAYYMGNAAGPGTFGPTVQLYSHNPLPSQCNPDNPNYVVPAYFHSDIFEEIRLDWKYLTKKNWAELKAKDYDFLTASWLDYYKQCKPTLDPTTEDVCENHIVALSNNPDAIVRPILPGQTMPATPIRDVVGKADKGVMPVSKETGGKFVPKRKTEAYYSDLINNKMITMNPAWNAAHKKACVPTATASVSDIVKPSKPIGTSPKKKAPVQRVKSKAKTLGK